MPNITRGSGADGGVSRQLTNAMGHAAFDFIESKWGKAGVRQFLMAVRQTAAGGDPYRQALAIGREEFDVAFAQYLSDRFARSAVAQSSTERVDEMKTVTLEGSVIAMNTSALPGLACLELLIKDASGTTQRWTAECGAASPQSAVGKLRPGDQVVVTGSPVRPPATNRAVLRVVLRPSDSFTWRVQPE